MSPELGSRWRNNRDGGVIQLDRVLEHFVCYFPVSGDYEEGGMHKATLLRDFTLINNEASAVEAKADSSSALAPLTSL